MLSLFALCIPVLAVWIWHPLWRAQRRRACVWWALATIVCGVAPVLLILAMRQALLPFAFVVHAQLISGVLFGAVGLLLVWSLLRDGASVLLLLLRMRSWACRLQRPCATYAVLVAGLLLASYGTWQGIRVPQVHTHEVQLPRLPAALDGLRIGVLADIHATPVNNAAYVQALVERINAAQPDLIVLPGDMVDGDAREGAGNVAPLSGLQAPWGVWSAPGNHEYYSGFNAWKRVYDALGLNYLANEARMLDIRGQRVAISGIGDPEYGRLSQQNDDPQFPEGVPPDIATIAQQVQAGGAQLHILLGHQPKLARSYAPYGVDLQIAGHTHGGHIRGMDRWIVAPVNDGFVRGLYEVGAMRLFVSSGAGLWPGFAVRLGVPPSIDILVLRAAQP